MRQGSTAALDAEAPEERRTPDVAVTQCVPSAMINDRGPPLKEVVSNQFSKGRVDGTIILQSRGIRRTRYAKDEMTNHGRRPFSTDPDAPSTLSSVTVWTLILMARALIGLFGWPLFRSRFRTVDSPA
ncbi:MAG: hypothetical protein LR120_03170 [Dehalococcoidia bacterium]|nr:hypothetical protein [Dehalococcoidia bacterium]